MKTVAEQMVELLKGFYPDEPNRAFSTDPAKLVKRRWIREFRNPKHPELKRLARLAVASAKRKRELIVGNCDGCGAEPRMSRDGKRLLMHAHHEDYAKPLDITWLCWRCHAKAHK